MERQRRKPCSQTSPGDSRSSTSGRFRADEFANATTEGITRGTDPETFASIRGSIDRINQLYEDVEPGDRYALTYVPGIGTELALNGRQLGLVEGEDFSAALFAIWIGDDPLDESLREQLLAGG